MQTLKDLFMEQIKDLYHAERQLLNVLPKLSTAASSDSLKTALDAHAEETREHITRLDRVFELMNEPPVERKCRAMMGIIAEASDVLNECGTEEVRDAAIVSSTQRIQHYELAGYGTARTYAETIGADEAAKVLQLTLDEERNMDNMLTELAQNAVNQEAVTA